MVVTNLELKQFIIETLGLEDIAPEDIGDDDPLFGAGLGLDSIDALELGIALRKKYQVQASGEEAIAREHFASVNALVAFIAQHGAVPPEPAT